MRVSPTKIPGVLKIELQPYRDERGFFVESWRKELWQKLELPTDFVSDAISFSRRQVLRGIHFQNPHPQAKLVSAVAGEIYDVAVDLRWGSPTFGKWTAEILSAENCLQLFIPKGFGHGFCVLSETALVSYKMTEVYHPGAQCCLRWDDPALSIAWPVQTPLVSAQDRKGLWLSQFGHDQLFQF